jgi:glutamate N-acetyltransferase / amino-acid N-acetyltransferase
MKNITNIEGVYSSAIHSGIKKDKKDLSFIYIPDAYSAAGVFTQNKFAAACISYTKKCIKKNNLKAIIINSGNANAATGETGKRNNKKIAQIAASHLKIKASEVGVASTGIIGEQLPMNMLETGLEKLLEDPYKKEGQLTTEAIMTTDTFAKTVYLEKDIDKKKIIVSGIAKGSGMIAPNMATMLSFIVTNVAITHKVLQKYLSEIVNDTFNMISVDTDTSTNDMVLIFSAGNEKNKLQTQEEVFEFKQMLREACEVLAKKIVMDGEGATKLIEVRVSGAVTLKEARTIAMNIVNSPLVKTAIHGGDPNWGRVMMAIGKEPQVKMNPDKIDLFFGNTHVFSNGKALDYNCTKLKKHLQSKKILIQVNLNLGEASTTAWGCDLTKEYVDINVAYS